MFNLLVTNSSGWNPNRGIMDESRTLEYTAEHLKARFAPNGVFDLNAVKELPTVFASENRWDGSQPPARVGTLTRIQLIGTKYHLEYIFDPDIPPIPNSLLFLTAADDLHINFPESSRNHWSIKDADLFKTLLKRGIGQRSKPKVFNLTDEPVNDNLVAVMMPFDAAFNPVYEVLKTAIGEVNMICQRADDIWENDHVVQDVVLLLCKAAIVVCDLSGRNANVFYEMGIAHTLGREVIPIAQSDADIPFDVAAIRRIKYLQNSEGLAKLSTDLKRRLETLKARKLIE